MTETVSPNQMTHLAQKLNNVDEKMTSLETDHKRLVSEVIPTLAKHSIIHVIIGGALVLMTPICATWIFKMTAYMDDMNRSVIILEERSRIYDNVPHSQTGLLGVGNYWKVSGERETSCLVSRTSLERKQNQYFLYSNRKLPSNLQF